MSEQSMTQNQQTYITIVEKWHSLVEQHYPEMRLGQCLMNALCDIDEDVYMTICVDFPDIDCFYNDGVLEETMKYLENVYGFNAR